MGQEEVVTRDDLLGYLSHDNVAAFLRVIREGESNQNTDAYQIMFGGDHFESFADHPRQVHTRNGLTSSAAGAYQFLQRTWDGLVKQYHFPDFSPISQDMGAVALIAGRGALRDVLEGRLDEAVQRTNREWASLPGSPYGQPVLTKEKAREVFQAYGGVIGGQVDRPLPEPIATPLPEREVSFMSPLILPILSALTSLIPQLGQLFGSGSEVANRNIAAGSILAQKITEVTNSVNLQEAAEKIQNSPEALRAARDAVSLTLPQLLESGGGGIAKAREVAYSTEQVPYWKNPAFVIAAFLSPLIYMVSVEILFNPSGQTWSDDIKMMFVTAIVSGLLGSITGFFLGSSLTTGGKRATDK